MPYRYVLIFSVLLFSFSVKAEDIDFNRDIRPILSDKCFRCHGPDAGERASDLRLDVKESATSTLESGVVAITANHPHQSELIRRITAADPDERMPPADSGKKLSTREIETLTDWIRRGAPWREHWSFVAPIRPKLPDVPHRKWVRNPIDRFVLHRLQKQGLSPSPTATPHALLRRLSFDLIGLPPSPSEVASHSDNETTWASTIDRLLHSPRFGEHQARFWLDAARYGDTHGLHLDNERSIWPYRDWVIRAFNRNMPFDQFTVEQLAGDLLPNPTHDQLVATGFNRCNVTTGEGGSIDEEYLVRYAVERVETTSTVWMGLTVGCAVCHDHKFDPISQKEFYQLSSYFFSLTEKAMDGNALLPPPIVKSPTRLQARQERATVKRIAKLEQQISSIRSGANDEFTAWTRTKQSEQEPIRRVPMDHVVYASFDENQGTEVSLGATKGKFIGTASWDAGKFQNAIRLDGDSHVEAGPIGDFEREEAFTFGGWVYRQSDNHMAILSKMDDKNAVRGYDLYVANGKVFVHLIHQWDKNAIRVNSIRPIVREKWQHVMATYDGSGKAEGVNIYIDGKLQKLKITHDSLTSSIKTKQPLRIGRRTPSAPFIGMLDEIRVFDRELTADEVVTIVGNDPIADILATAPSERTDEQNERLFEFYLKTHNEAYRTVRGKRLEAERRLNQIRTSFPSTLVMKEMAKPRDTHILIRGQYDNKGPKVEANVPAILPPLPNNAERNRLSLAKWLVDRRHPLTARVLVNRIWQQYFGHGLVASTEDFGSQGEWPSHPQLLDWLAVELMESGWNVKHIHRLIVDSATYRQSSKITNQHLAKDPSNRLYARGPRYRLDAECIRDNGLMMAGLLCDPIGGKSVRPYQPEGLWEAVGYTASNTARFKRDSGYALYRRSMYTFWKRTSPPPSMQILDAPSREVCTVRRPRTNTPAGALLLMNDVQFVEAARNFAQRIISEAGPNDANRIQYGFRWATSRSPDDEEVRLLSDLLAYYRNRYEHDETAASDLLTQGASPRNRQLSVVEHAAWTMVASTLMNLDESITKQ